MHKFKSMLMLCILAIAFIFPAEKTYANDQICYQQWYDFRMKLYVPRIYSNNESLGYRQYQWQTIKGKLSFDYNEDGTLIGMTFSNLVNRTHTLSNGKNVTYSGYLDDTKPFNAVAIGSNKTKKFKTASLCFSLMAEPSYNIGPFDEDTSLFVQLSGKGKIKNNALKTANGYVTGTLGCGCHAYGHVSPTHLLWLYGVSGIVTDIASVYGTWYLVRAK